MRVSVDLAEAPSIVANPRHGAFQLVRCSIKVGAQLFVRGNKRLVDLLRQVPIGETISGTGELTDVFDATIHVDRKLHDTHNLH
ncbi:hypothetical protein ASB66_021325 [Agrobacterium vitis]|nr:hypothetical protein ASB66_021325 [Agrobacterium vitis]